MNFYKFVGSNGADISIINANSDVKKLLSLAQIHKIFKIK